MLSLVDHLTIISVLYSSTAVQQQVKTKLMKNGQKTMLFVSVISATSAITWW